LLSLGITILCTCSTAQIASAQNNLSAMEQRWRRGEFALVLPDLIDYRVRTNDKSAYLDYMIATNACRSDRRETGYEFFQWILYNYALSAENRARVELESGRCQSTSAPETLRSDTPSSLVGLSYHGKGGFEYTPEGTGNSRATLIKPVPPEELAKRLFEPTESAAAVKFVGTLLGSDYLVESYGRFVVARRDDRPKAPTQVGPADPSQQRPLGDTKPDQLNRNDSVTQTKPPGSQKVTDPPTPNLKAQLPLSGVASDSALSGVGEMLERYLSFYASEYKLKTPRSLVTVYFAGSVRELISLAEKLHGIRLANGSIAYSSDNDQSMAGWASYQTYGTFAHELFHLIVRNGFGDIPPWLDEGTAALYEVSETKGDRIIGLPNWRGEVLRKNWDRRPAISDLVRMNRSAFDDAQPGGGSTYTAGEKQAVNHATARYFILYLQEKQRLRQVFEAFRDRRVSNNPESQALGLLESMLGRSPDQVDADFAQWFKSLRN